MQGYVMTNRCGTVLDNRFIYFWCKWSQFQWLGWGNKCFSPSPSMIPSQPAIWALFLSMSWFGFGFNIWWTEPFSYAGVSRSLCQVLLCQLDTVDCQLILFILSFSLSFGNFVSILEKEWSFASVVSWTGVIHSLCVLILACFLCFSCLIELIQVHVLADERATVWLICLWCKWKSGTSATPVVSLVMLKNANHVLFWCIPWWVDWFGFGVVCSNNFVVELIFLLVASPIAPNQFSWMV